MRRAFTGLTQEAQKLKCLTNKNHIAMNFRKPEIRKIQIEMEYGVMIPSSDPTPPGF